MNRNDRLIEFFRRYAEFSLGPEPERLADLYEESFLAAGPNGGSAFRNDEAFLEWLGRVSVANRESGMIGMAVDGVAETPLSGAYTIATVTWAATFRKTGDEPIRFRITYILRRMGDTLKVAGFISHEDQEEVLRAHGLL